MVPPNEIRLNEVAVACPLPTDAGLVFIGVIRTPWTSRQECPRQGRLDGPTCRLEIHEPWIAALDGIEAYQMIVPVFSRLPACSVGRRLGAGPADTGPVVAGKTEFGLPLANRLSS